MKFLLTAYLFTNFQRLRFKTLQTDYQNVLSFIIVLFFINFSFGLIIQDLYYATWLVKETIMISIVLFLSLFVKFSTIVEKSLIGIFFITNLLHVLQQIVGIRVPIFYRALDYTLLPGSHTNITEYGPGTIGLILFDFTGIWFNRINLLFDQPSTYILLVTVLAFYLLLSGQRWFATIFIMVGSLACPAKITLYYLPVFLLFLFIRGHDNFKIKLYRLTLIAAIFSITIVPYIVLYIGNTFYSGEYTSANSFDDSFIARTYWTWLYASGVPPWELMAVSNNRFFGGYDGLAAGFPFMLSGVIGFFLSRKGRYIAISIIFTRLMLLQYGNQLTMAWVFIVILLSVRKLNKND